MFTRFGQYSSSMSDLVLEFPMKSSAVAPVGSFDARDVDAEVLTLLHCDHLGRRLKAELLHHGLEVVLAGALRTGCSVFISKGHFEAACQQQAGLLPGC